MYVARASWPSSNGKVYQSIYLRESYRDGPHVRKRNIANLTHCDPQEIAAIDLALRCKGNVAALGSLDQVRLGQGPSVGALYGSRVWASPKRWAQALPANWICGRCGLGFWTRVHAYRPCGSRKCMRPAPCSASSAASTRTTSMPISVGSVSIKSGSRTGCLPRGDEGPRNRNCFF